MAVKLHFTHLLLLSVKLTFLMAELLQTDEIL